MANIATPHNLAVVGRRLDDLSALDPVEAGRWRALVGDLRAAGMFDDRRAMIAIAGISASITTEG